MNDFAERLELLRKEKNISQAKLASDMGVTKQSISNYINKRNRPDYEHLVEFAKYFECSVDYLLGYQDFRSNTAMRDYDQTVEENFNNSLKFMGIDKREFYLETITANTKSYKFLNGKPYSDKHFDLTLEVFTRMAAITALIVKIDNDTSENKVIECSIGDGKSVTLDSRSAEYVLYLNALLHNNLDGACKAIKALGSIGAEVLETNFSQLDMVLSSSKNKAKKLAKEMNDRFPDDKVDQQDEITQ